MNPEIFTHYRTQIRKKSKRSKRALLKAIVHTKKHVKSYIEVTMFYHSEIKQQAKVFRANFNQINKYERY